MRRAMKMLEIAVEGSDGSLQDDAVPPGTRLIGQTNLGKQRETGANQVEGSWG